MTWNEFWQLCKDWLNENAIAIIVAIITLVLGIFIIKILMYIIKKAFNKNKKMEKITISFFCSVIRIVLYILLLLIVSQMIGIPIAGFVSLLSIVGLAISLAIQDTLSNLFNGLILVSTKPFKTGEYVQIGDEEGTVLSINTMTTTLLTTDNKEIIIPNSTVAKEEIINYDRTGIRRLDLRFDVAYSSDINKVKEVILNVIKSDGRVYLDKKISINIDKFNDSSITFISKCWCDSEDYWDLKYLFNEQIFNEFKKNDISIPFDQLEVRLLNDEIKLPIDNKPLPIRIGKERKKEDETDFIKKIELKTEKKNKQKKNKNRN